jgi:N utilization substance protein B
MVSRRNIRVKVMQTLYTLDSFSNEIKSGEASTILNQKIKQTKDLFYYLIHAIVSVARYAEVDAHQKASKHLPTESDLNISTKISGNELVWKIVENKDFESALKNGKFSELLPSSLLKKIYNSFVDTIEYKEYAEETSRDKKAERKILDFLFNQLLLPNEDFIQHIEEHFINWDDDAEVMQTLISSYFAKPHDSVFKDLFTAEKTEFAKDLLRTVQEKQSYTLELIKPKLKNWDAERIASLDMILLQMGICEFLYFDTIPTKVTINEYIDLAKAYSTPQSGQFINGLLDNIHKELTAENRIQKTTYKNSTI